MRGEGIKILAFVSNSDGVFNSIEIEAQIKSITIKDNQFSVQRIIDLTKRPLSIDERTNEYMISYFSSMHNMFVYIGSLAKLTIDTLTTQDLGDKIQLKFRIKSIPLIDEEKLNQKGRDEKGNEFRRTKERKIGDVVQKVVQWRHVYNHPDSSGRTYSLDDAAQKVGMSK